jgi:hypothetical protein
MTVNTITAPAVRDRACPLCDTPAGEPCQPRPSGDHLARYMDSYTAGQLTRGYMAMVLGELVVIDDCAVVTAPACRYCGRTGTRLEFSQAQSANFHCQPTGRQLTHTQMLDWLADHLPPRQP